jgi:hypothetical protein
MKTHHQNGDFNELAMGRAFKQTHTEMIPSGDKLIKAAQNALWDAWQIGLQQGGNTIYPRLPLLDREPTEPEI